MIEEVLEYYNPWWSKEYPSPGIERETYLDRISDALELQKVVILFGLRRVGKTFILKQFVAKNVPVLGQRRIFYVSLDHPEINNVPIYELLDIFRKINKVKREENHILLLDEVQHRKDFEWELKAISDIEDGVQIIASGSSSLVVKHKSSALAGRYKKIRVEPLTFKEYLKFVGEEYDRSQPQLMKGLLDDYLFTGGIPHYVLNRDPQFLVDLVEDIIYKDIAQEYELRDPRVLKDLFFLLMDRIGKPLSYRKIGRLVDIGNDAAKKYIGYLEETYLLNLVERHGSPNERKYSPKKCYCPDNSLRVITVGRRGVGSLAENLVFNILRKDAEVFYVSRDNKEIDFIYGQTAVEVKYLDELLPGDLETIRKLHVKGLKKRIIITETGQKIDGLISLPLWRFAAGEERG